MEGCTVELIRGLVRDENLTRGLHDEEARLLVDWVVNWAELLTEAARDTKDAGVLLQRLSRRGKAISKFVQLWCDPQTRGAANQLAATERFSWPLPSHPVVAAPELMEHVLNWESHYQPD